MSMLDISGATGRLKVLVDRLSAAWAAKLDTLHTNYTAARAGYLDKLNLAGKATDDAVWTNARAALLDNIGTSGMPVIANGIFGTKPTRNYNTTLTGASAYYPSPLVRFLTDCCTAVACANLTTTYVTKLNLTGKGYIDFLAIARYYDGYGTTIKVTIDGVVAMELTLNSGGTGLWSVMSAIGDVAGLPPSAQGDLHNEQIILEQIPFFSSFVVEVKASAGTTSDATLYYHGRKTA